MNTEELVKNIISKHKGAVHKQQIARELKMGLDYIDLVCRGLERKGKIAFSDGSYSLIVSDHKPHQKEKFISSVSAKSVWSAIPKMTKELKDILEGAGYKTIESLADAPIARLMQETNLKLHEAAGLINQSRKAIDKI